MAKLPVFFTASTKAIAEKALERGILKYPGLCYIEEGNNIAWVTEKNEIRYTKGDKEITDVKFVGSNLQFFSDKKLLFSYDLSMTEEDQEHIVEVVKKEIGLDNYIKSSDLSTVLDSIIGNLEDKRTVVDYINSLSYTKLTDVPIQYLIGSLTVPITISNLDDGIYKIKGPYIIGGNNTSVRSSANDVFFLVSHDDDTHGTSITQIQGNSILLYFIQQDGDYTTDKYITEQWVNDKNFMSADSVKDYIQEQLTETVSDLVDQKLDEALDSKFSGLESADIVNIFNS
ncbi:MAG TPA: hypothetical protein DCW90_03175 [Lachnospiraceae bacterium]|nr:hypothetical protein [Lachnospiraceae bacterium]